MKHFFRVLLALSICSIVAAQNITQLDLAKDDGKGKPGQIVKGFASSDNPIHCVIRIKTLSGPAVFTGTLIAVNAAKVTNYPVATANLSASLGIDRLDFKFSLPRPWPGGSYKIEIKSKDKVLKDVSFDIK